jgi:hypothetical protein
VRAGDIVLLNFYGGTEADHCGLVEKKGTVCLYTIEGNTTPGMEGSQDNGGSVAQKMRYPRQIVAVCRPQYKADAGTPSSAPSGHLPPGEGGDDVDGHWAEDSIRWCVERGLMQGYPDGTFQPDKPVTRAELATVLRRLEGG